MEDYKKKYEEALENFKKIKAANKDNKELVDFIEYEYPELKESEDEKIRKNIISWLKNIEGQTIPINDYNSAIAWLEKQSEQKPNFCHHEVDLSNCSEEYRKAYYDGWNNCNQQHSQLEAEQKPAWSEEDEDKLNKIIDLVSNYINDEDPGDMTYEEHKNFYIKHINWLKSIKERMKGE